MITGAAVLGAILVGVVITSATPWPSAMVIRAVFEKGGTATAAETQEYVPDTPLRTMSDIAYADDSPDTTLDVFTPAAAGDRLPAIVWIHGGAWISGSADNVAPYLKILAGGGYTAIAVNYSVGPEEVYPTAVHQINTALDYITAHADQLGVDTDRMVLAGDSAGAQAREPDRDDRHQPGLCPPARHPTRADAHAARRRGARLRRVRPAGDGGPERSGRLGAEDLTVGLHRHEGLVRRVLGRHDVDDRVRHRGLPADVHQRRQRRRTDLARRASRWRSG
ncbi:alpha/beta hydrolase [Microbacterium elymi]|uniref:Alpha/beta hydrolase n=1 Tax=Microbacterium elymi TaxID=2909587 RepID=A0ABY5NI38_9MICO|nr:alpha/beta hydrolase [Microbacterium elymi]UUT34852.1 alpha/beta hydrolase [Microbacterium elymi]